MVVSTRPNHTHLLLLAAVPYVELPGVAVIVAAFPEVADVSVLGASGTLAMLVASLAVAMWGIAVAWSSSPPTVGTRWAVGASLSVLSGVLAVPTVGFLASGRWIVPGVLLAHCGLTMVLIAKQATRGADPTPTSASRR